MNARTGNPLLLHYKFDQNICFKEFEVVKSTLAFIFKQKVSFRDFS